MIGVVNKLTARDYHDFYRRYVDGVETPPYDEILSYAGYKLDKSATPAISAGRPGASGPGRRGGARTSKPRTNYSLSELPNPTAQQLRIRNAWLETSK
jgi:hypothetical protein